MTGVVSVDSVREVDLREAAAFVSRHVAGTSGAPSHGGFAPLTEGDLRWRLLANPARAQDVPLGWVLRSPVGGIVGIKLCMPQRFDYGDSTYTVLVSTDYYVDEAHRGRGIALFMKYRALGAKHALLATTANATSGALWHRLGGYAVAHSDRELLGVVRWGPVLEEMVHRQTHAAALSRATGAVSGWAAGVAHRLDLPAVPASTLRVADSEEGIARIGGCPEGGLTATRDKPFLRWRHFDNAGSTSYVCEGLGTAEGAAVIVSLNRRGYRRQIRALNIIDMQAGLEGDSLMLVVAALIREFRGSVDMVVIRCVDDKVADMLTDHGFINRPLAAPTAWCMDTHGLLPTSAWRLAPADSMINTSNLAMNTG